MATSRKWTREDARELRRVRRRIQELGEPGGVDRFRLAALRASEARLSDKLNVCMGGVALTPDQRAQRAVWHA